MTGAALAVLAEALSMTTEAVCVSTWLERSGQQAGYVMDVSTLWRLASGWYAGRLDRGYVRREPSAAADYLRRAGLSGPFWGQPD